MTGPAIDGEHQASDREPRLGVWRAFLTAHARITRSLEHELQATHGMSLAEYDVLVQLSAVGDRRLRMSELADRLVLSRSGATRLVERLAAEGLVERVSCDSDRRGQWAVLTDAGADRLGRVAPTPLRGVARQFLAHVPPDDQPALTRMFDRLGRS
jgi:DNA-binding MarR family transcriptional regulator